MTQRREIEGRLALYEDLAGILGAMRSFALAELHRVLHREKAQQQAVQAISAALQEVAEFLPPQAPAEHDLWILFGSVRGFCGSFNEDIVRGWRNAQPTPCATIVVGERLQSMLLAEKNILPVDGADGSLDAASAIDRILSAFEQARTLTGDRCGLLACYRDDEGVQIQRLLPLPQPQKYSRAPPLMNEAPQGVGANVAKHYLFHLLLSLQLRAIRVENHMRLMQMETALQHLERSSEDLQRQRNRMRQEEIVEEIELMLRKKEVQLG